ncbi:MAG: ABC transporter permease [Rhodococcus sp. (in: high G+C Gram-positive bacteria)]|uniref:ABC transporter permease n=1 Tax=Rhodococcus sp. TaxID=1831 RepID=UPI003BB5CE8F
MFLGIRDLVFAKGRFALTIVVLFLLTLMVVMLSGLTAGLGNQSIAAVQRIGADHFAFSAPAGDQKVSFSDSRVGDTQRDSLAAQPGVDEAVILGVAPTRLSVDGRDVGASAFGVDGSSFVAPVPLTSGKVAVDRTLAEDNNWAVGQQVDAGGRTFTVAALVDDSFYSHQPVVWFDRSDWTALPTSGGSEGSVVALRTSAGFDAAATSASTGTAVTDVSGALNAIGGYSSERGSLLMMQGMLLAVSALVVGAFFTVWTIQRSQDLAVLKAIGASSGYLLRDALGQGLIVLVAGAGLGTLAAMGLGALAAQVVPFTLTVAGTLVPFVALVVLGMVGATAAVTRVATIDPLAALGAAR